MADDRKPLYFRVTQSSLLYLLVRCVWDTKKFAASTHRGEDFLYMLWETAWFAIGMVGLELWRRRQRS